MRKVKNNIHMGNPAVMFAQGLESLINDPLHSPSQHDGEQLAEMRRSSHKPDSQGNLFGALMRQFANR